MTEDLRVDTALVRQSGGKLETIAGLIPEPPASFSPAGADALSTAIAGRVSEVVDPVLAQMPIAKDELTRFAQNVMAAADSYDATDRQIAEEIFKRREPIHRHIERIVCVVSRLRFPLFPERPPLIFMRASIATHKPTLSVQRKREGRSGELTSESLLPPLAT